MESACARAHLQVGNRVGVGSGGGVEGRHAVGKASSASPPTATTRPIEGRDDRGCELQSHHLHALEVRIYCRNNCLVSNMYVNAKGIWQTPSLWTHLSNGFDIDALRLADRHAMICTSFSGLHLPDRQGY